VTESWARRHAAGWLEREEPKPAGPADGPAPSESVTTH
jgi:hypothetical protein